MTPPPTLFHALLRPTVLQILRATGFHSTRPAVLDSLTELAARYLLLLSHATATHAIINNSSGSYEYCGGGGSGSSGGTGLPIGYDESTYAFLRQYVDLELDEDGGNESPGRNEDGDAKRRDLESSMINLQGSAAAATPPKDSQNGVEDKENGANRINGDNQNVGSSAATPMVLDDDDDNNNNEAQMGDRNGITNTKNGDAMEGIEATSTQQTRSPSEESDFEGILRQRWEQLVPVMAAVAEPPRATIVDVRMALQDVGALVPERFAVAPLKKIRRLVQRKDKKAPKQDDTNNKNGDSESRKPEVEGSAAQPASAVSNGELEPAENLGLSTTDQAMQDIPEGAAIAVTTKETEKRDGPEGNDMADTKATDTTTANTEKPQDPDKARTEEADEEIEDDEEEWEEFYQEEEEDIRGVSDFVAWFSGPRMKEIQALMTIDGEPEATDYLNALKKKHSKTGEDSKYHGTILGRGNETGQVLVEGGGDDMASISAWMDARRVPLAAPDADLPPLLPGDTREAPSSRPPSSGLSSLGDRIDEDMDMDLV